MPPATSRSADAGGARRDGVPPPRSAGADGHAPSAAGTDTDALIARVRRAHAALLRAHQAAQRPGEPAGTGR